MTLSPESLAEMQALADKATPQPWEAKGFSFSPIYAPNGPPMGKDVIRAEDGRVYSEHSADSASVIMRDEDIEFIAAARQFVPDAIAEIERLRAALEKIQRDAKAYRKASQLTGPSEYDSDVRARKIWERTCYRLGKTFDEACRAALQGDTDDNGL